MRGGEDERGDDICVSDFSGCMGEGRGEDPAYTWAGQR